MLKIKYYQTTAWEVFKKRPTDEVYVSGFRAQLIERRTGIARSRVQIPLKTWIFQASKRVHICEDHSLFDSLVLQIISCLNHLFRYLYLQIFLGIRIFSCLFDPLKMLIVKWNLGQI